MNGQHPGGHVPGDSGSADQRQPNLDAVLRERWPSSLAQHTDLRDRLLAAYAEPHRGYHDRLHLAEVLTRLEELSAAETHAPPDDATVLAAWFHDAVYAGHGDDEERSAALAEQELAARHQPPDLVAEVARLVRLTTDHDPADDDHRGRLLCDADLAILAADPDRYAAYTDGVRREYVHVPEADFRVGRARVLEALLAKPALFHTAAARRRWEEAARANLTAEVGRLRRPG